MAETQQVVTTTSSNEEENPEAETSRSRRRFKASHMSFEEMVEMVQILKRADYDGEKRLSPSEDNMNPPPPQEGVQSFVVPQDVEEGEVEEVMEFGTTTGDVQVVVPKSSHFTSDNAQRLIQEILSCSRDLDLIKEKTKVIEQRLKNMIDVLGRI